MKKEKRKLKTPKKGRIVVHCRDSPPGLVLRSEYSIPRTARRKGMKKRKYERENGSNEKYYTGRHTNNLSSEEILSLKDRELKGKKAIVNGSIRTFPFPISHSSPPSATI